tara:strand:+ start:2610 stop:3701 length:1092 start_codon:yes stop_codon:yes gene_type:complete
MKTVLRNKIEHLSIKESSTVTEALRQMDAIDKKLLLVVDSKGDYKSIVSVGDVQRHLIKQQDFETKIKSLIRENIRVAKKDDSIENIKKEMLAYRMEFMPVVDAKNTLVDIVFWEDLFKEQSLKNKPSLDLPVVIMAGGKGSRLKPITNIIPKPLIPLGDKTIMEHIIERFVDHGCNQFFVCVNYKDKMIKDHFKELASTSYSLSFVKEEKPLGTVGALSLLKKELKKPFFLSNCDILVNQSLDEMYSYHKENNNELTLIGALKTMKMGYGTLEVDKDGLLNEITEKPEINMMVNAGLYLVEPHLLDGIPENSFYHITHLINAILKRKGRVGVFPVSEASWLDIGNWTVYNETLKTLGETPII